jgi:hypothetical protein
MLLLGLAGMLPGQQPDAATGLAKARRALTAEPEYQGKPRYLLMAMGQPITRSVWIVLDGTTLYVDRDGDGRLDGTKERFEPRIEKQKDSFVAESHEYDVGGLPATDHSPAYPGLTLSLNLWNLDHAGTGDVARAMEVLRRDPKLCNPTVTLQREGRPKQFAMTEFAASQAEANVLHFDGPTTWGVVENLVRTSFTPGTEFNFKVSIGTPGLGPWSFVYTTSKDRRVELRPEIAVVFREAEKPVQRQWTLFDWC